jgi:hypothetical protein
MKNETPEDREADVQMLKSARSQYASLRVALEATVERLQAGETPPIKNVKDFAKEFQSMLFAVIKIEAALAKRSDEQCGGGGFACVVAGCGPTV